MKKIGVFFLSFIMLFVISSCGKNSESHSGEQIHSSSLIDNTSENVEKRPIWILGHHCNSNYKGNTGVLHNQDDRDVYKALASGCNGVEVDLAHRKSDDEIILWHLGEIVSNAETLTQFLAIPEMNDPRMTMVIFDIKDYEYINQIVETTHDFYKNDPKNQKIHFVYSVSELSKLEVDEDPYYRFREVAPSLWPNEALEVDYENDANAVQKMFDDIKFTRGIFGNGIFSGQARGNIESSCKIAINIKNNSENPYRFKAVESWTVDRLENENLILYENVGLAERIQWGCDIVLADGFKNLDVKTYDTFYGNELFVKNPSVRLADIRDYPFGSK